MKQPELPNYNELSRVLSKTTLKLHPSQVHGVICGLLCGSTLPEEAAWEAIVTGDKKPAKTHELLQALYDISAKQLSEFLFEYELFLPDDATALAIRAEALTLWSQGFLTGLKLRQIQITDREPSEMTEAINDIVEIAKMNYEEVVDSTEDEAAYVELVEYIRMAVILIYEDSHERDAPKRVASSHQNLH